MLTDIWEKGCDGERNEQRLSISRQRRKNESNWFKAQTSFC